MKIFLTLVLLTFTVFAYAETKPEDGGDELEVWTGGGHSVSGRQGGTEIWNAGGSFGWILTRPHGPGFLKGRFEYALEGTPLFLVFQPTNTTYGAGFSPLNLKWILATRGCLAPYLE